MSKYTELLRGKLMHKWQQALRPVHPHRTLCRSNSLDLLIRPLAVILSLLPPESDLTLCIQSGISGVISDLVDCGDPALAMIVANPLARLSIDDLITIAKRSSDHRVKALAMHRIVYSQHFAMLPNRYMPHSQFKENSPMYTRIDSLLTDIQDDSTSSISSLTVMDLALELHGITLAQEYQSGKAYEVTTRSNIERWIRMLRLAVEERSVSLPLRPCE